MELNILAICFFLELVLGLKKLILSKMLLSCLILSRILVSNLIIILNCSEDASSIDLYSGGNNILLHEQNTGQKA
jgi:hypothetical protein